MRRLRGHRNPPPIRRSNSHQDNMRPQFSSLLWFERRRLGFFSSRSLPPSSSWWWWWWWWMDCQMLPFKNSLGLSPWLKPGTARRTKFQGWFQFPHGGSQPTRSFVVALFIVSFCCRLPTWSLFQVGASTNSQSNPELWLYWAWAAKLWLSRSTRADFNLKCVSEGSQWSRSSSCRRLDLRLLDCFLLPWRCQDIKNQSSCLNFTLYIHLKHLKCWRKAKS